VRCVGEDFRGEGTSSWSVMMGQTGMQLGDRGSAGGGGMRR
jgi:hypothetical protein